MSQTIPLTLEKLLEGYRLCCQAEAKSPKTIEWYSSFLTRFRIFLERNQMPDDPCLITKENIRAFIYYLQKEAKTPHSNKPLSPITVQGYVRSLKAFFSWLVKEDYVNHNVMDHIPLPKAPIKIINTLTEEQIQKLTTLCNSSAKSGYRNLCLILLMLDTGIRVSELASIDENDVDLNQGGITIRIAKGGKERIIPMGSLVQKMLWRYINTYRPKPLTSKITRLFLNDAGTPLTKNGIQQLLRRYGKRAGISGTRCSPHTFRHTFAKNYLLNGGDIFSLQKILGHSSLASVRLYLNLFACDIKRQHQRFSPVDNLAQCSQGNFLLRSCNQGDHLKGR